MPFGRLLLLGGPMFRRLSIPLICLLGVSLGCATKSYVRQQVTPVINKVNELDDLTAQNTKSIKETDERVQTAIREVDSAVGGANQKAQGADQEAQQAQVRADNVVQKVTNVEKVVADSDDYKVVKETSVQFAAGSFELSGGSKARLGELVGDASGLSNSVVVVEGFTDSKGGADDNYALS